MGLRIDSTRDRLFVATVIFTLLMTVLFAGALVYDFVNNGGGGTARRVITSTETITAGPTPSAGASASTITHAGSSIAGRTIGSGSGNTAIIPPGAPITIGEVVTQSGPLDASDAIKADSAYVQTINAQGGINGHKLVLDTGDDNGDPARGKSAFERIVQEDNALAIVGECAPLTDATIVDEIKQLQVPVVNDCLTAESGYSSPYIWFNIMQPSYWQAISARYLYKQRSQLHVTRPYVLCTNTSVTLEYCNGFVNEWKRLGGTTCSGGACNGGYDSEQVGMQRPQFDTVAVRIQGSGADSIVSLLDPNNQAAFLQALQDQNMCPGSSPHPWPQYAPLGMDPNSVSAGGDCSKGVVVDLSGSYFPTENTTGEQQLKAALDRYEPGTPVDAYSLTVGWTPMVIFTEALRRMGTNISRQNLISTLNSMNGFNPVGLCRPLTWTSANHAAAPYTRWGRVTGVSAYDVMTGWIDQNGNPAG